MPSGTFVPQFVQKAMISPFFKVTVIHHSIFVPQPLQKRCPAITSVPQFGQKRFAAGALLHGLRQTGSTLLAKVGSLRIIGPAIGAAMLLLLGFPAGTFLGLGTFEGGFPPPACWLRVNLALPLSPDSSRRHPSHILAVRDGHRSFPPFPRTLSSRSGH